MNGVIQLVMGRGRLFGAIGAGIAGGLLLPSNLALLARGIMGWDIGCAFFLILMALMFSRNRENSIADDAERQQTGEWAIFWFTVAGVTVSFAALIGEFSASKELPASVRGWHAVLVAATLLLSWTLTHTLFALRYAHEYYERDPGSADVDKGLEFPGGEEPDYWDFFYFSIVLGMTFQVSDVQITSRKLRRLATAHGVLSFLFNTIVLALSVNIGASLL